MGLRSAVRPRQGRRDPHGRTRSGAMNIVLTAEIARQTYRPAAHPIVRIHLLGPMRATSYLGEDVLPRAKKARAILGHLCLAFGAPVPRARIAAMLWDRVSAAQARTS